MVQGSIRLVCCDQDYAIRKLRLDVAQRIINCVCEKCNPNLPRQKDARALGTIQEHATDTFNDGEGCNPIDLRCNGRHEKSGMARAQFLAEEVYCSKLLRYQECEMWVTDLRERVRSTIRQTGSHACYEDFDVLLTRVEHLRRIVAEVHSKVDASRKNLDSLLDNTSARGNPGDRTEFNSLDAQVEQLVTL